jgi:replicative DNA helicase
VTNPMLAAALELAARGLPVFPLWPRSKIPRIPERDGGRGFHDGTTDPDTITSWWTRWPDANIGVAIPAGHLVLDVDPRKGGDVTWQELAMGRSVETLTAVSGRGDGGFHLYMIAPPGQINCAPGPGVDIKVGGAGYVVAPPSVHPDSHQPYYWDADKSDAIVAPPDWVTEFIVRPEVKAQAPARFSPVGPGDGDDGPAGDFNRRTNWFDVLTQDGWIVHSRSGDEIRWTRPGKSTGEGMSATTGHQGRDLLKVFTSSVPGLDAEGAYSRFGYYAAMHCGGDRSDAARRLRKLGYGGTSPDFDPVGWIERQVTKVVVPASVDPDTGEVVNDEAWEDPTPLGMGPRDLPEFPVDVLPQWMAEHVQAVADDIQVPVDLPATIALAALAAATSRFVEVDADGWVTYTNLYLVVASPPGQGKSPVFTAMTNCLEELQADIAAKLGPDIARAELAKRVSEKQSRKAEEKGDIDEAWIHYQAAMNVEIPKPPRLIADDATPEALTSLLADNQARMAVMSSEGGVFDLMTGKYSDRANLEVFLKAWSGDTIQVDRIHREAEYVRKPALTIGLTVQPMVIQRLANKPELAGRGLTARFMYSLPPSNVGTRDMTRRRAKRSAQQKVYDAALIDLYSRMSAYSTPGRISLSDADVDRFFAWRDSIEKRRGEGGDLHGMAEWTTKLEASVLRLTGLLHLAYGGAHHGVIDAGMLELALVVGDYWIQHAFAVHDLWGTDDTLAGARMILGWLSREGVETFTASDVQKKLRSHFDRIKDVVEPIGLLVERGWIRPMFEGPLEVGKRGSPSKRFATHPTAKPVDKYAGSGVVVREWCTTWPDDPKVVPHSRHVPKGISGAHSFSLDGVGEGVPPANDANGAQLASSGESAPVDDETTPYDPFGEATRPVVDDWF